ncbi:Tnks, partial [Symbiodinium microadriaticum]
ATAIAETAATTRDTIRQVADVVAECIIGCIVLVISIFVASLFAILFIPVGWLLHRFFSCFSSAESSVAVSCLVAALLPLWFFLECLQELWSGSRRSPKLSTPPASNRDDDPESAPASALRGPEWQYLHGDQWRPSSNEYTECLERAHKSGQLVCEATVGRHTYDVNLQQLTQKNRATGVQRRIRRVIRKEVVHGDAAVTHLRDREKQLAEQQEQIDRLQRELSELSEQRDADEDKIRRLSRLLSQEKTRSRGISEQKAADERKIRQLSQELSDQKAQLQDLSEQKARLSQQASKDRDFRIYLIKRLEEQLLSRIPDVDAVSSQSLSSSSLLEQPVPAGVPLHRALSRLFLASMTRHRESTGSDNFCDPPQVEITRICESINPSSLDQYRHARKFLAQKRPDGSTSLQGISAFKCKVEDGHVNLNEHVLFHGCPFGAVKSILENGLDPQRGGEATGQMFGAGAYFAENASKSDFYTTCSECSSCKDCKHAEAERCILVARVLLGETKVVTTENCSSWKRAPEGYDSVTAQKKSNGGRVDHTEFVVYKEQMALVRWLIFYRHKSDCQCHSCKYRRGW